MQMLEMWEALNFGSSFSLGGKSVGGLNFSITVSSLVYLLIDWSVLVQLHELGEIELRLLDNLDLSDHGATEWENFVTLLLDFVSNFFFNPV